MDDIHSVPASHLLDDVFRCASPFAWNSQWRFLPPQESVRGPILEPQEVLQTLLKKYTLAELQAANLLDPCAGGEPRLRAELTAADAVLIGLRDGAEGPYTTLMTSAGSLPRPLDPMALAQVDAVTRQQMEETDTLFVAFAARETAVLRALGMPAVVAGEWDQWDVAVLRSYDCSGEVADHRQQMIAEMRAEISKESDASESTREPSVDGPSDPPSSSASAPDPSSDSGREKVQVVLVGWSPWDLTLPYDAHLTRTADFLADFERHLGMDFEIAVWQLTQKMKCLRFRVKHGLVKEIMELLRDSSEEVFALETFSTAYRVSKPTAPSDVVSARAALVRELLRVPFCGELPNESRRAQDLFEQCVERDLIAPLYQSALGEPDAATRTAEMLLADVFRSVIRLSPRVDMCLGQDVRFPDSPNVPAVDERLLENYLRLMNQFSSLVGDLMRLRRG